MTGDKPILMVEDNPMDVDLAMRAFKRRKMTRPIEVARDGEEALSRITRQDAGEPQPVVIRPGLKLPSLMGLKCCGN